MRVVSAILLSLSFLAALPLPAVAVPRSSSDFGVFCIQGRLIVDTRCIEELKAQHGQDVCRLDQDPSEPGAQDKALRLGGVGSDCACD